MSLHKLVNKLNLNNEMFVPKIEGCNCEEDEQEFVDPSEVNETIDGIKADMDDLEEANEVTDDVEAFLAERVDAIKDDGLKEVPIEEQVAVQEKLREVLRVTGLTLTNSLNKESLGNIEAYHMNLEGLKEVMSNIGEVIRSIWEKIVAAIKKLIKELASLLPSKIKSIDKMIKALEEHKGFTVSPNETRTLDYDFEKLYMDRFVAASSIFTKGGKLAYFKSMDKFANELEGFFRNFNAGKVTNISNGLKFESNSINSFIHPDIIKAIKDKSGNGNYPIFNINVNYRSVAAKYITGIKENELNVDRVFIEDAFRDYRHNFNIQSVIQELNIDKQCLAYVGPFMERLETAANGIAKATGDNNLDKEDMKVFRGSLTAMFKSLFTDYLAIIQTMATYDLAVGRTLLLYFKKITR